MPLLKTSSFASCRSFATVSSIQDTLTFEEALLSDFNTKVASDFDMVLQDSDPSDLKMIGDALGVEHRGVSKVPDAKCPIQGTIYIGTLESYHVWFPCNCPKKANICYL